MSRAGDGRHRLLIVDDQPANIRVMAEALRDEYELFFATSGARALEIAEANDIALVLLDVVMPELDGFEVCRRLKAGERTSRTPVIFVTAREETSDETDGFDAGAVDYITKPIRPPVVRARVKTQLELKEARDMLESLASIDALTGIGNRRRFDAALEAEWKRCSRSGQPFSVAIADVDHYKRFNDHFGHARGDECLRTVARSIQSVARRPSDVVARYGGEEFGLVLPETDAGAARLLMRRALDAVAQSGIPHPTSTCGDLVTVSVGGVTLVPRGGIEPRYALEKADAMLYRAKQAGRNQAWHTDLTTGEAIRVRALEPDEATQEQ